jgi:hypothetical protein
MDEKPKAMENFQARLTFSSHQQVELRGCGLHGFDAIGIDRT